MFAVLIFSLITIILLSNTDSTIYAIPMFILGISVWNVFEYTFHRWAFHNHKIPKIIRKYLTNGHIVHHRYPNKTKGLQLPLSLSLPVSLFNLAVIYLVFGSNNIGWFYLGLMGGGLLVYEFMHYAAHHLDINWKIFKDMKQYHLDHHYKTPKKKFMVSNPIMDWIFKT